MSNRSRPARRRALTCAAALLLGAAGTSAAHAATTSTPTSTTPSSASPAFKTPRLYVLNDYAGTLTGVDAATGAVRTQVSLKQPRGVGMFPLQMQASHNGHVIYVLSVGASQTAPTTLGTFAAVDSFTDKVIGTAPIAFNANGFVLSRDGKYAYVTAPGAVYKVNLSTMRVVAKVVDANLMFAPQISPDGKTLYVAEAHGKNVLVIDTQTMTVASTIAVTANLNATALSPDGSELYVANTTRRLTVLSTVTGAVVATIAVAPQTNNLSMSPDGSKLYASGYNGEIYVIKTATNKFSKKIPVETYNGVEFSPDGTSAYVLTGGSGNTSRILTIDPVSQAIRSTLVVKGSYDYFGLSPDGSQMWASGSSGTIAVDLKADKEIGKISSEFAEAVAFGGNGKAEYGFVGDDDTDAVDVYNTQTFKQHAIVPSEFIRPQAVAVTPNGQTAYVTPQVGSTVRAVDLATGTPTADISVGPGPYTLAATPDGAHVVVANSNTLSVIDTSTNTVVATIPVGVGARQIRISPDSRTAYLLGNGKLIFVDLTTHAVTATLPLGSVGGYALALSPDGSTAYVDGPSKVAQIDIATHTITRTLTAGVNSNAGLAVSPDGSTLYLVGSVDYTSKTGDFYEVNLATGAVSAGIPVGAGPAGLVLSADGSTAYVSNGGANTVSVVNTATDAVTSTWTFGTGYLGSANDGIVYSND